MTKEKPLIEIFRDIEQTLLTVGKLSDYQKRIVVQVFIDINNNYKEAVEKLKEWKDNYEWELGEMSSNGINRVVTEKEIGEFLDKFDEVIDDSIFGRFE